MKSARIFSLLAFILFVNSSEIFGIQTIQDTTKLKDGIYTGMSRAKYTAEPYWGKVLVTVKDGRIAKIDFTIRDSTLHETFNLSYAKHFEGKPLYIQQTKNDWNGVQVYPRKALEAGNPLKIDAISGATWSYNIFKAALEEALNKARTKVQ
jgi:uncharacterized protein with FMN-binding domain